VGDRCSWRRWREPQGWCGGKEACGCGHGEISSFTRKGLLGRYLSRAVIPIGGVRGSQLSHGSERTPTGRQRTGLIACDLPFGKQEVTRNTELRC
jgi:hypothetical protein